MITINIKYNFLFFIRISILSFSALFIIAGCGSPSEKNEYNLSRQVFIEDIINKIENDYDIFKKIAYCRMIDYFLSINEIALPANLQVKIERLTNAGKGIKAEIGGVPEAIKRSSVVGEYFFQKINAEFKEKGYLDLKSLYVIERLISYAVDEFSDKYKMMGFLKECFDRDRYTKVNHGTVPIASYYYADKDEKHFSNNFPSIGWVDIWFSDVGFDKETETSVCVTFLYAYNYDSSLWHQVDFNYKEIVIDKGGDSS